MEKAVQNGRLDVDYERPFKKPVSQELIECLVSFFSLSSFDPQDQFAGHQQGFILAETFLDVVFDPLLNARITGQRASPLRKDLIGDYAGSRCWKFAYDVGLYPILDSLNRCTVGVCDGLRDLYLCDDSSHSFTPLFSVQVFVFVAVHDFKVHGCCIG
jgi:hypothetical protein